MEENQRFHFTSRSKIYRCVSRWNSNWSLVLNPSRQMWHIPVWIDECSSFFSSWENVLGQYSHLYLITVLITVFFFTMLKLLPLVSELCVFCSLWWDTECNSWFGAPFWNVTDDGGSLSALKICSCPAVICGYYCWVKTLHTETNHLYC